jgi:putative protease
MSAMNELRRNACDRLYEIRSEIKAVPCQLNATLQVEAKAKTDTICYRARFAKVEQIPSAIVKQLKAIILPIDEVIKHQEALEPIKDKVIIEPYRILFLCERSQFDKLTQLKEQGYTQMIADNLAHIQMGKELGFTVHAGSYLNCINSWSADKLAELDVSDITMSFETELHKANSIKATKPLGLIVYGYLPLMIMKNCPIRAKHNCADCNGTKQLTDRKEISFRVICNQKKYCEVLNSSPLYMAERMHEIKNCSFATLYFTVESKPQIEQIFKKYQLNQSTTGEFTRGLYYRSI